MMRAHRKVADVDSQKSAGRVVLWHRMPEYITALLDLAAHGLRFPSNVGGIRASASKKGPDADADEFALSTQAHPHVVGGPPDHPKMTFVSAFSIFSLCTQHPWRVR